MTAVHSLSRRVQRLALGIAAPAAFAVASANAAPAASTPAAPKPATPAPATKAAASSTTKGIQWLDSYEDAVARAKKEHKLVLLDFMTDWCGWCKRLDKDVFAVPSFQQAADGVLAVKVNAEKRPDLAMRYQVNSYPKLFFLNSDGVTIERIRGYLSLGDFTDRLNAVKAGDTEFKRLQDAAMDPTNLPAIYTFARYLADSRQAEMGIQYWQQVHDLALQQLFQSPGAPGPMNYHREALIELGRGYQAVGLDDVARQNYEEVIRMYADNPLAADALMGLAQLEMKKPSGKAKADEYLARIERDYPGTQAMMQVAQMRRAAQAQATPAK